MNKKIVYLVLGFILLVGFTLRNHDLTVWPREGATFDEFAWTFQGISIFTKGVPTSWSPLSAYKNRVEYKNPQGTRFTLVTPYLEHPPLFGLVAGGFAYLRGIRIFDDVTIDKIRPLALVLGMISIVGVFLLSSQIYGSVIGLLSAGIYAIIPTTVVGSRLVQNENFFIPFFLFALYFTARYIMEKHSSWYSKNLLFAACFSALAPLAKVPWMGASLAVVCILLYFKKWKAGLFVIGMVAISFSTYIFYGLMLDKEVFLNLWKFQMARYDMTFASLFVLFRDPLVADRTFVDGWLYMGWAAFICLLADNNKKNMYVAIGLLAYFAVFVFAIPSESLHGWYRYPFYPFLAIALAVFLKRFFNSNYFIMAIFFIITGSALLETTWQRLYGFSYPILRSYLLVVAFGALPGLFPSLSGKKLFRWVNWMILLFIILLTLWSSNLYNEQ